MLYSAIASLAFGVGATAQVTSQNSSGTRLRVDNGTYGPEIEEVHYCTFTLPRLLFKPVQTLTFQKTTTNGPSALQPHQMDVFLHLTPEVTTATRWA